MYIPKSVTYAQFQDIKRAAEQVGLELIVDRSVAERFAPMFKFYTKDGRVVLACATLTAAMEAVTSGYIKSWNGATFVAGIL